MSEHFTKNTLETTRWCNICCRSTQWHVWSGRLGRCKEDHHQAKKTAPAVLENKQLSLFPDAGGNL